MVEYVMPDNFTCLLYEPDSVDKIRREQTSEAAESNFL